LSYLAAKRPVTKDEKSQNLLKQAGMIQVQYIWRSHPFHFIVHLLKDAYLNHTCKSEYLQTSEKGAKIVYKL
jgi:hypothetical protein